jgi:predicted thioredoxin/glutaredoxin
MLILAIVVVAFVFALGYFIGTQNEAVPDGTFDGKLVVKSIEDEDESRVVLSMQFENEIDIDDIEKKKQVTFLVVTE